ncbi:MAG: hypothetical protein IPJ07_14400 [Acidobacteria bacterium]|nr:hypothetical protein [Acidobacteriota bacterium]
MPGHFPSHWLNFYDPRDFLAYIAEPVFPADPVRKITDIRVNNREPFPQSHTSYWNNDDLWDAINDRINEALQ